MVQIIAGDKGKGKTKYLLDKANAAIKEALADIEEACRESFLRDIAENRGYEKSQIGTLFSRRAYYNRKRKAIYDIARLLRLI